MITTVGVQWYLYTELKLEGRSMKEGNSVIFTSGGYTEWALWSHCGRIQGLSLTADLTH